MVVFDAHQLLPLEPNGRTWQPISAWAGRSGGKRRPVRQATGIEIAPSQAITKGNLQCSGSSRS